MREIEEGSRKEWNSRSGIGPRRPPTERAAASVSTDPDESQFWIWGGGGTAARGDGKLVEIALEEAVGKRAGECWPHYGNENVVLRSEVLGPGAHTYMYQLYDASMR